MLKLNRIAKQRFRRAADAEEGLRHVPFLGRIALPDQGPGRNIQANQLALGAEDVAVCDQKRRAARAVVIPEWINKTRVVSVAPERSAGRGLKSLDDFLVGQPMVQDQALVDRKSTRLNSSHLG